MRNPKNKTLLIILLSAVLSSALSCSTNINANNGAPVDAGDISSVRSMNMGRAAHTATLLPNGKVLIAGGFVGDERGLASAEIYDPAAKAFTQTADMTVARQSHTATLLPNGKVLVAGGFNGNYVDSAELYDPATGRFTPTGRMVVARSGHVATLLSNGKVLLAGGTGTGWTFLANAELYDPATNSFSATGKMAVARESHTATLLANGKVLITGGHRGRRQSITIYSSAEIYDPAAGAFTPTGGMTRIRHKHDATLLADGSVLIVGGADKRDGDGAYTSAEIYNPATGAFAALGNMNAARYKLQGTCVLLPNGKVLIAGGADRAEIFDPLTKFFSYAGGEMGTKRLFATATLLRSGKVLIVGGYDAGIAASPNAWIYGA